jgi:hypothetical protein
MAGRKKSDDPLLFSNIGLRQSDRRYLSLWSPRSGNDSGHDSACAKVNLTECVSELLERAQKFWPAGPNVFPLRDVNNVSRHRAPRAVAIYAKANGLTRSDTLALFAKRYLDEHPEVLLDGVETKK